MSNLFMGDSLASNLVAAVFASAGHAILTIPVFKLYAMIKKITKVIAVIISIAAVLLNYWMILAAAALDLADKGKSNQWSYSYLVQYFQDLLIN